MIQARPVNDGAETGGTGVSGVAEIEKLAVRITVQGCATEEVNLFGGGQGVGSDWLGFVEGWGLECRVGRFRSGDRKRAMTEIALVTTDKCSPGHSPKPQT